LERAQVLVALELGLVLVLEWAQEELVLVRVELVEE
jgi:hypothetical protein